MEPAAYRGVGRSGATLYHKVSLFLALFYDLIESFKRLMERYTYDKRCTGEYHEFSYL